jgi:wyosine [tRNA(Phe)-imidazoG37] synthetase (radical SAM superfamily)
MAALEAGAEPDYLTLSGSGEPTLNSRLGEVVGRLKDMSSVPVALVTNATLLHRDDVRADCSEVDLVLPSLDAGDEETFRSLNRPHSGIAIEDIIEGLARLRRESPARMWLEVFVVPGVNTGEEQVEALVHAVERISPDRVQLNTAVRPPAEEHVRLAARETLEQIMDRMGPRCELIAEPEQVQQDRGMSQAAENVLTMLRRRPCTAAEVAAGLSINDKEVLKELDRLSRAGKITSSRKAGKVYYRADE